jgi:hypothetical protein
MLITGHLIAQWNVQRFIYALVMLTGVAAFFLGLIFFIVDTQPQVVWLTILLTSLVFYILIQGVQTASSFRSLPFGPDPRPRLQRILSPPEYLVEENRSRHVMFERQNLVAGVYKLCKDQGYV